MSITTNINQEHKQTSESKRFLNHFESINTPIKVSPIFTSSAISKNKYSSTLEMYASSISIIDKIADSPVKESKVNCVLGDKKSYVEMPMVISLNPRIKEKVIAVNHFFNPVKGENFRFHSKQEEGNVNNYIENILSIDMNNVLPRPEEEHKQGHSRSKSKELMNKKEVEINKQVVPPQLLIPKPKTKEVEIKEEAIVMTDKSSSKLKKIELLLKEIHYEKKRRGLVPDYLRAIQMKLTEFFDYILHDDPEYFGLSLFDKMKKVLNNMECLKGKKIDGESKIEMLKIFFEEFRDLKNESQKEEEQRENKELSKPKLKSKSRETKENPKLQEKKSVKNELIYPLSSKNKRNNESLSLGGGRSSKKISVKNEVKEEDQWIGCL